MVSATNRFKRLARWVSVIAGVVMVGVMLAAVMLWQRRVQVVTRAAHKLLARQGVEDLSFRLSALSPWRLTVRDVRWGSGAAPLAEIDRIDLHYTLDDLRRRHLERLHVQGVRTTVLVEDGKCASPLVERLKPLLDAARAKQGEPVPTSDAPPFSFWMATLRDVQIAVADPSDPAAPMAGLAFSCGGVAETDGRYRFWGQAQGDGAATGTLFRMKVAGTVEPARGAVTLSPELTLPDLGGCMATARRLLPAALSRCEMEPAAGAGLTARGDFAVVSWTNIQPFRLSAELGRGSRFDLPSRPAHAVLQSVRLDVSGTPQDVQARFSAGLSGFAWGEGLSATQERGRLFSLRGTTRLRQDGTGQRLNASLESDLPGRSIAKLLPRVLPLVPIFFTDGGTLKVNADMARPLSGAWNGQVRYEAEALRSSAPISGTYVGAQAVRVAGEAAIEASKPGTVRCGIALEDGYVFRDAFRLTGSVDATLTAQPPYQEARGTFTGHLGDKRAFAKLPISLEDGRVRFEGEAVVDGLTSHPVWRVSLMMPEATAAWTQQQAQVTGRLGGTAEIRYSAESLAAHGAVWARAITAQAGPATNPVVTAGAEQIGARFEIPLFARTERPQWMADVTLAVSNAWATGAGDARLEQAAAELPFTWSAAEGLAFRSGQRLSWQRLAAQGVDVETDGMAWATDGDAVTVQAALRLAESALRVQMAARVPLKEPRATVLTVTLPEMALEPEGTLAALIRDKTAGAEVGGRVAAEANVRFLGTRPYVTGRVRVNEGWLRNSKAEVRGVTADVPFLAGVIFRTIESPFVSFTEAKAGNVRFGRGRVDFQVTNRGIFVDRAEVGWCRGSLNAYSVNWEFANPSDDFVVYADRIDLGEALMMVMPFKGRMEGVLYGRFPVGIDKGHVRLAPGFLYSLPGQGGVLRLEDSEQMRSLLDRSGIKGDVQGPLAKALSDLDFNTLKLDLEPREDGEGTLRIKLVGKSNDRAWPAPVDLNLNLHGPLEKLVNMRLDMSRQ
ncbi:MAG TPA: YdbH domain-containing protein [Kiritimatiellia bacterium]|nr:YdbH domain-containing protein [Kiritimatiellia bacterium]HRU70247.1 YdbH domain-containing protein [Kiritimatiellia bacterium]